MSTRPPFFTEEEFKTYSYSYFADFTHHFRPEEKLVNVTPVKLPEPVIEDPEIVVSTDITNTDFKTETEVEIPPVTLNVKFPVHVVPSAPITVTEEHTKSDKVAKRKKSKRKKRVLVKEGENPTTKQPRPSSSTYFPCSNLTVKEHKSFLLLKATFKSLRQTKSVLDPDKQEQLKIFHILEKKVIAEQCKFRKWHESNPLTYTLHPFISQYVKAMLAYQAKRVLNYPRYYITKDQIAVIGLDQGPMGGKSFQYLGSPLLLGTVPWMILPKSSSQLKFLSQEGSNMRIPAAHPERTVQDGILCKTVVSRDKNAQILALKHDVHLVMSSGSLMTMFATHSMCLDNNWDIPVVVKEHHLVGGLTKKVVYLDKPLTRPNLTVQQQNLLYYKRALKSAVLHPAHLKVFVFAKPGTAATELVSLDKASPRMIGSVVGKPSRQGATRRDPVPDKNRITQTGDDSGEIPANGGPKTDASKDAEQTIDYHTEPNKIADFTEEQLQQPGSSTSEGNAKRVTPPAPARRLQLESRRDSKNSELSDDSTSDHLVIDSLSDASVSSDPVTTSRRTPQPSATAVNGIVTRSRSRSAETVLPEGAAAAAADDDDGSFSSTVAPLQSKETDESLDASNGIRTQKPAVIGSKDDEAKPIDQPECPSSNEPVTTNSYDVPNDGANVGYHLWNLGSTIMLIRGSVDGICQIGRLANAELAFYNVCPKLEYLSKHGGESLSFSECASQWMSAALLPKGKLARVRVCARTSKIVGVENLNLPEVVPSYSNFRPQECLKILLKITEKAARLPVGNYLLDHQAGGGVVRILKEIPATARLAHENVYDLHTELHNVNPSHLTDSEVIPPRNIDPDVTLFKRGNVIPGVLPPKRGNYSS